MEKSILEQVYDGESFRKMGHKLVDQLADNLLNNHKPQPNKVIDWIAPDDHYNYWKKLGKMEPDELFRTIMERSIQLHHPRYMGHQVTVPAPLAALAAFQGALLNSGGAIYEMSAASSTLEKVVIDAFKGYFGFDEGSGFITSGGTIANLTALICARNVRAEGDVWNDGQEQKYAFMVSEQAHYCIDRAVKIMGWGDAGAIKIPVDDRYAIRTDLLGQYHEKAKKEGITVLGIVGSAPTTSTGIYDDLRAIGQYCKTHGLWYHIDGAHGGPAVFSEKYRHLMSGSEMADSITVDAHKMMMTPSLTTMLFFRKSTDSFKTFAQKAEYLWSAADEAWYDYGKRTMECTKIMLSTRIFVLLHVYGMKAFEAYLDKCYDMGNTFADMIQADSEFELAVRPETNIVCFRVVAGSDKISNELNGKIRQKLLEEGDFYIVQTMLRNKTYLRVSIMNPFTTMDDLSTLLNKIKRMK